MRTSLFSTISIGSIIAVLATLVLLVLPFTDNFISISKNFILFFSLLLITALFIIRSMRRRAVEVPLTPFTIPLLLFVVAVAASTFFTNAYPVEGLLGMGGVYLSFALLALFGSALISAKQSNTLLIGFAGVVTALIFVSALDFTAAGPADLINSVFGLQLPSTVLFNLTGSPLIALQLTLLAMTGIITHLVVTKKLDKPFAIMLPILLVGLAIFSWSMLPGNPATPTLPSFAASWSVMLDSLHNPRAAMIGVGPASFGNAYLQFKPLWINSTQTWSIPFIQGANTPLTLVTSIGILGFAAWSWLVFRILRGVKTASAHAAPFAWMLGMSIVLQLILPPNVVILGVQALLLAAFIAIEKSKYSTLRIRALEAHVVKKENSETTTAALPLATIISGTLSLILVAGLAFFTGRAYAAHYHMGMSEKAAGENDGVGVYNHQMAAVNLNPYLDTFRRSWANTNIVLAAALSNKTDATEAEKEQSSQLVQQAVREARSATLLDPNDAQNWTTLAQIYSNLIGSSEEADQWAVQAYVQAIETNPSDPVLRVALGGIFSSQENYQQAATFFNQAIELKQDFPNAYYNLGMSLKMLEQYTQAKEVMTALLTLIPEETDDYVVVTEEIAALDELIAANPPADAQAAGDVGEIDPSQGAEAGLPPSNPSLVDQNLEQSNSVVNSPSNAQLNVDESELNPANSPVEDVQPESTETP